MSAPHEEGHRFVAQEGVYAAASSTVPVIHYYPARGRAEPIRLALAYAQQEWFEPPVEPIVPILRRQLDGYTFRQLPRFIDERNGKVDIVQSMAILRHIGRKFDLYGQGLEDAAFIDMVVDGVQDIRAKIKDVWWKRDDPAPVEAYLSTVCAPEAELLESPMRGPGLACLERLVADIPDEGPWLGGGPKITIADLAVFDLVDTHLSAPELAGAVRARFPALAAHHRRVAGQPGIREYLASDNRHPYVFADEWRVANGHAAQVAGK